MVRLTVVGCPRSSLRASGPTASTVGAGEPVILCRLMTARLRFATLTATITVHLMVALAASQEPCQDTGQDPYPCVAEGPRVNGKPHGAWVLRYADGDVAEGSYVDGRRNADWVIRRANGTVIDAPFADGKTSRRLGLALRGRNESDCPVRAGQADQAGLRAFAAGRGNEPMTAGAGSTTWAVTPRRPQSEAESRPRAGSDRTALAPAARRSMNARTTRRSEGRTRAVAGPITRPSVNEQWPTSMSKRRTTGRTAGRFDRATVNGPDTPPEPVPAWVSSTRGGHGRQPRRPYATPGPPSGTPPATLRPVLGKRRGLPATRPACLGQLLFQALDLLLQAVVRSRAVESGGWKHSFPG